MSDIEDDRRCPMCNRVVPDGVVICPYCAAGVELVNGKKK